MLSGLLVLLSCTVLLLLIIRAGRFDLRAFFAVIPLSMLSFVAALIIGSLIADPLQSLSRKIKAARAGDITVDFTPRGELYEADMLAQDFKDLMARYQNQCQELIRREKQEKQFVGNVAHELRTPLTAIRGNAELLLDPDLPPALHEKFCNTIVSEAERLSHLVNDLLTIQHVEEDNLVTEMERVNLKNIAQEAVDALSPVLSDRQANINITGEAPDVLGNRNRLKQVVSNLVDNASRFIEPGGHIQIELYGIGENSVIAVTDDGTGFGDVEPKLLFERFYRTDFSRARNTGGSGLGLSIVKSIVEAHDGTVEAFNRPEGGACFLVAIPAIPAD